MSESHQFVPVALWLKFLRGPTCALHCRWTLALCARGHWNRMFLRWPALQLGQGRPLRLLRDRGGLSTVHAPTQLLCDAFAVGAISVAWWQRFTDRPEHPFVREAIPPRVNRGR